MGVGGVGKSAITNRFVVGRWIEKYDPTVEESYQTTVDIEGKAMQVEILDTAGQDEYTPLRETFMHTGDGFLLVYSITDDQTLEELRSIREQVLRVHRNKKVPMVVIGNKMDMAKKDRAVSKEEGKALAQEFGASFLEVSAKENFKVKESFEMLIKKILSKNAKTGSSSRAGPSGVFGDGKGDPADFDNDPGKKKTKKSAGTKSNSSRGVEKTPPKKAPVTKEKEKGKCILI